MTADASTKQMQQLRILSRCVLGSQVKFDL